MYYIFLGFREITDNTFLVLPLCMNPARVANTQESLFLVN